MRAVLAFATLVGGMLTLMPPDADAETARKVVRLIEMLDEHDDVQNVYSNLNMTEELMAELGKEE